MRIITAEVPAPATDLTVIPDGMDALALLPEWVQGLGILGIAILISVAFARNWVYTSKQVDNLLNAERRVGDTWERNADRLIESVDKMVGALDPVLKGNEAILKAVTEIQSEQYRFRERGGRR